MARKTYLQLVNEVLIRLREDEVTSVSLTSYSKLIGKIVNDAKRDVEAAYTWNALSETITVTTSPDIFSYTLLNTQPNFRVLDVVNNTNDVFMSVAPSSQMNLWLLSDGRVTGQPSKYNFNGVSSDGDTIVDLYPIPNGVYNINFNIINPQPELVNDTDGLAVPYDPVVALAYAKALVERGEDGGLNSSEAYAIYKTILADHIAIESSRYLEEASFLSI